MTSLDLKVVAPVAEVASASQSLNQPGHIHTNNALHKADLHSHLQQQKPVDEHGPDVKVTVRAAFVITPDGIMHRLDGDGYVPYIDPIQSYLPKTYA